MLKDRERELDESMLKLLDRLERALYQELTIDEFEKLRFPDRDSGSEKN
jgi:hypothetical protein